MQRNERKKTKEEEEAEEEYRIPTEKRTTSCWKERRADEGGVVGSGMKFANAPTSSAEGGGMEGCISSRNARGGRDMAVKERRKSVASTKGASWRGEGWLASEEEGEEGASGIRRKRGRWLERARIIFAEEKALPLFAVAEGTEVRIRGGLKIQRRARK